MVRTPPLLLAFLLSLGPVARAKDANAADFGVRAGGSFDNAAPLQRAIDEVAATGGGCVVVPAGRYSTGALRLRSHVTLRLMPEAVLFAGAPAATYARNPGFIDISNCQDVTVDGGGVIDGNGGSFTQANEAPGRPDLVLLHGSREVTLRDITLRDSARWTLHIDGSDEVMVRGVRIRSQCNFNNDGIDIDGRDIVVPDCLIDASDDGICLKSDQRSPCENVSVTNCVIASNCNLIKMGTASAAGFRNISISNCVLRAATEDRFRHWQQAIPGVSKPLTAISGIALESVDGGTLDGVVISNISMVDVQTPLFLRLGHRHGGGPGTFRRVVISDIVASSESLLPSSIVGIPGGDVQDVTLRNILISAEGGGTAADAAMRVPENISAYPENRMFGPALPAYGLFVRHACGISLEHVRFELRHPDERPAIVAEEVRDFTVQDLAAAPPAGAAPLLRFRSCADCRVIDYRGGERVRQLVDPIGLGPGDLVLRDNDLRLVDRIAAVGAADARTVVEIGNLH